VGHTQTSPGSHRSVDAPVERTGQTVVSLWQRVAARRGSSPFRLRSLMGVTVVLAVVFALVGAYGVNRRRSEIDAARHSAAQLLTLQNIRVAVVQADSLASQAYLIGGDETLAERTAYLDQIAAASTQLVIVSLQLSLGGAQTTALSAISSSLATYVGLVETARANNRQGFPVGAAYQRDANRIIIRDIVPQLRIVEQSQRDAVNSELASAHRAGAWLPLIGWLLVALVVAGGVWMALRFRRLLNVPLAIAALALLVLLLAGGAAQSSSMGDADAAVRGALTNADLVAQARAAGFDARSQEALTLINRGNGAANEANWKLSSSIVDAALTSACDHDGSSCALSAAYAAYSRGHVQVRSLDDGGNWDGAVAASLGTQDTATVSGPFDKFATSSQTVLQDSATAARRALADSTSSLETVRITAFLVGLLAAVLTLAGYGQRLREYR
jgi:hypothetical protein